MPKHSARPLVTLTRLFGGYCKADDASLLGRYQSVQDAAAFDELIHRHGPLVLGLCHRMLGHTQWLLPIAKKQNPLRMAQYGYKKKS
jgi:hypothetical protein